MDWLKKTAEDLVRSTIVVLNRAYPDVADEDKGYTYHRTFLHMGYLYSNLREAIQFENGPEIIRMWRYWLLHLLGGGKYNYSCEAVNLLANLDADWTENIAYIHTNHRTVNTSGKPGHGKPIDQLVEHYYLYFVTRK